MGMLKAALALDTILLALISVLFVFFSYAANGWVVSVDKNIMELRQAKEIATAERAGIVVESRARWDENLRKLNAIEKKLDEIQQLVYRQDGRNGRSR